MATREILTIQLGHYANFIGTHWWNIQETNFSYDPENTSEINPDVLYREGEFGKKVTYTPRLLIADLKGSLGYLSEEGNLGEIFPESFDQGPEILWDETKIEKTEEPKAEKSAFVKSLDQQAGNQGETSFDLENESNKWVDYLIPRYNSRTVNVITEYEHESTTQLFNVFPAGQNLWKTTKFSEIFADRIRAYVEECDLMQGFQVLFDVNDAFSGLGASCIQHLRDEYGKSIITWPVIDAAPRNRSFSDYVKIINTVLCWQQIGENASLFSPLCCSENSWLTPTKPRIFEDLTYKSNLKYHTSALLATALDTLSIRYRHKKYTMSSLSDLCADLNKFGRKAVATSLSLPFPLHKDEDLIDMLDNLDGSCPWKTLTPHCNIDMNHTMHSLALRGIPESRLKRPVGHEAALEQMMKGAYRSSSVHEMMSLFLDCTGQGCGTYLTTVERALQIKNPYPKIFKNNVQINGDVSGDVRTEDVRSVPVMAGLHNGNFMVQMYEALHENVKKIRSINKFHAFESLGLEQDEFKESINNLLECQENYEDHYV